MPLKQSPKNDSRDADDSVNKKPRIFNLTPTLSCLNFTRPDMKRVRSETQIREVFVRENPSFTVVDATIPAEIKQAIEYEVLH